MSTTARETASVSLSIERWKIIRSALLSHALQLSREGEDRLALELVNEILPAIRQDGRGRTLDALELKVRAQVEVA